MSRRGRKSGNRQEEMHKLLINFYKNRRDAELFSFLQQYKKETGYSYIEIIKEALEEKMRREWLQK